MQVNQIKRKAKTACRTNQRAKRPFASKPPFGLERAKRPFQSKGPFGLVKGPFGPKRSGFLPQPIQAQHFQSSDFKSTSIRSRSTPTRRRFASSGLYNHRFTHRKGVRSGFVRSAFGVRSDFRFLHSSVIRLKHREQLGFSGEPSAVSLTW